MISSFSFLTTPSSCTCLKAGFLVPDPVYLPGYYNRSGILLLHFFVQLPDHLICFCPRNPEVGYDGIYAELLGETEGASDTVCELDCNVDDMTAEDIGFAMEQLFKAGARDVYTQPIGMKKSRPGVLLSVVCLPEDADRLAAVMMKHTSTLGIRRQDMSRYVLERSIETVETPYGPVRVKTASGMGVQRRKAEYDDLVSLAEKLNMPLESIRKSL